MSPVQFVALRTGFPRLGNAVWDWPQKATALQLTCIPAEEETLMTKKLAGL